MRSKIVLSSFLTLASVALPSVVRAQSAIAGQVTDTTGAVLPGVTVEASSPALISGARTVVTDGQGRYSVEQLVPGVYKVAFSLEGFSTTVREGIELVSNFTAPINVQMRIGSLDESVTVTGASPVVDVSRNVSQTVMPRDVLEGVPTGRGWAQAGVLIPGVVASLPDVGGTSGMHQAYLSVHGSLPGQSTPLIDGMNISCMASSGNVPCNYTDDGAFQEISYISGGGSAEVQSSGIAMNLIPKEGGNQVSGTGVNLYADSHLASSNFSDALKGRGLTSPPTLVKLWDYDWNAGGPILQSKLWFFGAYRNWGVNTTVPNSFDEQGNVGIDDNLLQSLLGRITYQMDAKNKFSAFYNRLPRWRGHREIAPGIEPRATVLNETIAPYIAQAKWTSVLTRRFLVEAGVSVPTHAYANPYNPAVKPTDIAKEDVVLGTLRNAYRRALVSHFAAKNIMASVVYVTGTHSFKAGLQNKWGYSNTYTYVNGDLVQRYRAGVPFEVSVSNTPTDQMVKQDYDLGLYAQDSWRLSRLTINPGLRFDTLRESIPVQESPAGRFVPARTVAEISNQPHWKDVSPRLGLTYDLFGNGKTVAKFSTGKFILQDNALYAARYNPLSITTELRSWTDSNHDDIAQDNEIGPSRNASFGLPVGTNTLDPDNRRPYDVVLEGSVQRELLPRMALSFGYARRQSYNVLFTENTALSAADYALLQIPDPRGNGQVLPIYNLNAAKVGLTKNVDRTSSQNSVLWRGFDLTLNARFGRGGTLLTGVSSGQTINQTCDVTEPNSLRFCDQSLLSVPYRTQYKISGSYPLPWGVAVGAFFQSVPGAERTISYVVSRAVLPQLSLSSVTVRLNEPGSIYYDRNNQLDLKFSKVIQYKKTRLTPQLDIFNATNTATVINQINAFGPTLDSVRSVLNPRFVRVGMNLNF